MFELAQPSKGMKLLHWNEELPTASAADPLGLNLRVSARLSDELLYCITSITPRARYYSFFPWAFQNYNEQERKQRSDRGRVQGILIREKALVLGTVLHHEGKACKDGGLGGSDKAIELVIKKTKSYNLMHWRHLEDDEGQFGAAYKGSLINLGVFATKGITTDNQDDANSVELDERTRAIEVTELSSLGKRLADAFQKSVRHTDYVVNQLSLKNRVSADALSRFGSRAGLCEISGSQAFDRDVLRNVFFACDDDVGKREQRRRRMSLLLILECVSQANARGVTFGNSSFCDICYFGTLLIDGSTRKAIKIKIPPALHDICQRWQIFYTQNYLGVALQSMLVACVRLTRDRPGGITFRRVVHTLNTPGLSTRFRNYFGGKSTKDFFTLTASETLSVCGVESNRVANTVPIESPSSERNIEHLLIHAEANDVGCLAFASVLLYQVLLRYDSRVSNSMNNWYEQHVYKDNSDISVPGVLRFLNREFGEAWFDHSNAKILSRILMHFIFRQHEKMSYERGFGGSPPLFHIDDTEIIGTGIDYTDPRMLNPRLSSALQILSDLSLIYEDDNVYTLTSEGKAWLASEIQREMGA